MIGDYGALVDLHFELQPWWYDKFYYESENVCFRMSSKTLREEYDKLQEVESKIDRLLSEKDNKSIKVQLLHEFNDIKDATQIVINYIANVEGTTVSKVHKRLNLLDWNKRFIYDGTFYLKTNTTPYNSFNKI